MTWVETLTTIGKVAVILVMIYIIYKAIAPRVGFEAPTLDQIRGWF